MPDFETNAQFEANAQFRAYGEILEEQPDAIAVIQGGSEYPDIRGEVWLYQLKSGVLVAAEVYGLPASLASICMPVTCRPCSAVTVTL